MKKISDDLKGLREYILRQRLNVRTAVPESDLIDDIDFARICMLALHEMGQLTKHRDPDGTEVYTLRPGFVPEPKFLGVICGACEARVRAIKTGSAERFVRDEAAAAKRPPMLGPEERPVLELDLETHLREIHRFAAGLVPEFGRLRFDDLCRLLPGLVQQGCVEETKVNGQSVWRMSRKFRKMLGLKK